MKEETEFKPKPLVEIGGMPILWHIMKIYRHFGERDFVLALGYKGQMIKEFFLRRKFRGDFALDTGMGALKFFNAVDDDFNIHFAETGLESITGERILRVQPYLTGENFMVTYGDGVADIDITALVAFHRKQGTLATITGVHPYSKYGLVSVDRATGRVTGFEQKPRLHDYVNGGFMVFRREALAYIDNGPLEDAFPRLAEKGELSLFVHEGFWKAMDTQREMEELNALWNQGRPWAVWERSTHD